MKPEIVGVVIDGEPVEAVKLESISTTDGLQWEVLYHKMKIYHLNVQTGKIDKIITLW